MSDRALLIRLGALGDTIQASSAARLLKRQFPGVQVDFLASAGFEGLFSLIPEVDRVFSLPYRKLPLAIHPVWRRVKSRFGEEAYGLAFLMETNPRFLPLLRQVRAHRKISLAGQEDLVPDLVETGPVAVRYQRALWAAGVAPGEVCHPRLVTGPAERQRANELLESLGFNPRAPLVGVHPGNSFRGRKRWKSRMRKSDLRSWPEDRWGDLVAGMHRLNPHAQFVLFGSLQDSPANVRIQKNLRQRHAGMPVANAAGQTDLPLAAALLERFSLFLTTDTGPIHMAAALGVRLIGLYGPTRYEETRPFPEQAAAAVLRRSLPCQPCYGTPRQAKCRDNVCMRSIEVEEVLEKAREVRPDLFAR